ncbi:MAG: hypothetical protein QOJ73_3079 [Streptosporangiaceae bacterium]|nr:hypothetical protein [Streptosporangiaceae bacterium]
MAPPRPAPVPKARSGRPAEPAHQQRALAGLFLALLSLFGLLGGLHNFQRGSYIAAFTLLAGVLAVWLAITSLARARRGGTMSPRGSVTAIAVGTLGVLLSGSLLIVLAAFGPQVVRFSQCYSGANTLAAKQVCRNQFIHAVQSATSGR